MLAVILPYLFMLVLAIEGAIAIYTRELVFIFVVGATSILGVAGYRAAPALYKSFTRSTKDTADADIPASETSTITDKTDIASTQSAHAHTPKSASTDPLYPTLYASDSFHGFEFAPRAPSPDPTIHYSVKSSDLDPPQAAPTNAIRRDSLRARLAAIASLSQWPRRTQPPPILPVHASPASCPLPAWVPATLPRDRQTSESAATNETVSPLDAAAHQSEQAPVLVAEAYDMRVVSMHVFAKQPNVERGSAVPLESGRRIA